MTTKANYRSGADVLDGWRDDVMSGEPPTFYPIGEGNSLASKSGRDW